MSHTPQLVAIARVAANEAGLQLEEFCGNGAYKETFRAIDATGKIVALKVVDLNKIDRSRANREIDALRRCNVSSIAQLISYKEMVCNDKLSYAIVVEEFIDGGTLTAKIASSPFSQNEIKKLVRGLIEPLSELQRLRLVHRDIKPDNIMFRKDDERPVLVDFGLVRDLSESSLTMSWVPSGPGTPFYSSPEQLNNEKEMIDWRSDQFSLGVVAGEMLCGQHPYQEDGMTPSEAVYAVAARRSISDSFIKKAAAANLGMLCTMMQSWPVNRFQKVSSLFDATT